MKRMTCVRHAGEGSMGHGTLGKSDRGIQWQQRCEATKRVCVGRRRSVTQMEKDSWSCSCKALVSKSC